MNGFYLNLQYVNSIKLISSCYEIRRLHDFYHFIHLVWVIFNVERRSTLSIENVNKVNILIR